MSVLNWVQTIYKGYQQTTKVTVKYSLFNDIQNFEIVFPFFIFFASLCIVCIVAFQNGTPVHALSSECGNRLQLTLVTSSCTIFIVSC